MSDQGTKKTRKSPDPTRHIKRNATLDLWVRSGGRCAICNKFLLEEPYFERPINLGERAHVAGWKDTAGSPRGDSPLPLSERNEEKNLILLCSDHHKIVDHVDTRADFPEERLLEIKREHEERIHHLTAMSHDRETTVLRLFSAVRGSIPEMTRELAMRTVVDGSGRYARFPLSVDRHSIEINLAHLPEPEEDDSYWRLGCREIDKVAQRVSEFIHEKHIRHLSIFALARIPLLVYLGYVLDDKVPVELYQKHRMEGEGWIWPEDSAPVRFEGVERRAGTQRGAVVLMLSLSGTINLEDLPDEVRDFDVFEIRPAGVTPNRNLFRSRANLDSFVRAYQDFLAELERSHKETATIHLFPSVPITAAIACGRSLMRHVQPALCVYDRIGNQFQPTITVNENPK